MNRNLIITFFLLTHTATPMMAMRRGLKHMKDNPWVEQVASENEKIEVLLTINATLPLFVPLTDELLLKENAWWQDVRNWPQDEKNQLLRKTMDRTLNNSWSERREGRLCDPEKYAQLRGHVALAIAIGADAAIKSLKVPSVTPLAMSLEQDDPALARYLKGKGVQLDKERAEKFLRKTKNGQMADLLLECGAAIPANILFEPTLPAQIMAVYLKRGVNPEQNRAGETPLHSIAWMISPETIAKATMLIEAGVNLEAQNAQGDTALHKATVHAADQNYFDLCNTIINGCVEGHRKYQATMIALLHCTGNTMRRPIFQGGGQLPKLHKDIVKGPLRQLLKPLHSASPLKLLNIKNSNQQTPYSSCGSYISSELRAILNPERFAQKKATEKK